MLLRAAFELPGERPEAAYMYHAPLAYASLAKGLRHGI